MVDQFVPLVQGGISSHLMKASSIRRRSKAQILQDKQAALKKEEDIRHKLAAWDEMEAALEESEQKNKKLMEQHQDVEAMFDGGLLKMNQEGQYEAVRDEEETQSIKARISMSKRKTTMAPIDLNQASAQLDQLDGSIDGYGLE